jgi:pimeloyl-ACP methyl ester carboxylesterase
VSSSSQTSHWILLRGLAREARHWNDFPEQLKAALAARGDTARIDALDLPGAGRFSEMKSPLSISEMTEFAREKFIEIRRRMRERGETPPERTRIVAVSMGGMIAADWMERWPTDFKECVLINTSFAGFSPLHHRLTPGAMKHIFGTLRKRTKIEQTMHEMELVVNTLDKNSRREIAEKWKTYFEERPFTLENFTRQLYAASRFKAPIETPVVPTLVLYSENDRMVSSACSKEIAKRWKAPSASHPTAGHDLTIDDAKWVIEKTLAWEFNLKEIPGEHDSLRSVP